MRAHPSLSLPPALGLGLEQRTAHLLSLCLTTGYVGSLYLAQHLPGLRFSAASSSTSETGSSPSSDYIDALKAPPPGPSEKDIHDAEGYELVDPDLGVSVPSLPKITSSAPEPVSEPAPVDPPAGSRDHPATIRRRITAVGLATGVGLLGVGWIVAQIGNYGLVDAVSGLWHLVTLPLLGLHTAPAPAHEPR